jgi:tetratricopeptide (TPR) repeat protein
MTCAVAGSALVLLPWCLLAGAVSAGAQPQEPTAPNALAARVEARLASVRESVLTGSGSSPETIAIVQQILADDPRQAEAHFLLGILYTRSDTLDLAAEGISELRQALALAPENILARLYLGRAYLDSGRTRRAQEELQEGVVRDPRRPDLLTWLGESERVLGNATRAVELGRQALQLDASSPVIRYHLGRALLDLGRHDEAIVEIEHAVRVGAESSDVFEHLGAAYLDAGRPADALPVLLRAASLTPISPGPRLLLARAYRLDGQLAKAEEQLGFAWRMLDNFGAQVTRGELKPPAGSAADFVLRLEVDARVERGLLLGKRGEPDAALDSLAQALKLAGADGRIHRHLAEVALDAGRLPLAREHAEAAAALGYPLAAEARAALDRASGRDQ